MSSELPEQPGLPAAVVATRQAIVDAAVACDWSALRALTAPAGDEFVYSFGGGVDPVAYWQESEPMPNGLLKVMVVVLRAPHGPYEGGGGFAWPEAFVSDDPLTEADLLPVAEIHSEAELEQFREFGSYIGWRIGIRDDGTWQFFVAGD